jgi:mercuric ion transport protein
MSESTVPQERTGEIQTDAIQGGRKESAALAVGAAAALLVGSCCVAPLVLITMGLSGAWLANLAALEPYRPFFVVVALASLAFAWRRIYRPASECKPGQTCAAPAVRRTYSSASGWSRRFLS